MAENVAVQGHHALVGASHRDATLDALLSREGRCYSSRPLFRGRLERVARDGRRDSNLTDATTASRVDDAHGYQVLARTAATVLVVRAWALFALAVDDIVRTRTRARGDAVDILSYAPYLVGPLLEETERTLGAGAGAGIGAWVR